MNKPDRAIKIRPEYHLIVTEGTDTEPAYFGAIQEIINRQYPEKIQLKIFGVGDNTVSLFEKAKQGDEFYLSVIQESAEKFAKIVMLFFMPALLYKGSAHPDCPVCHRCNGETSTFPGYTWCNRC